MFYSIIMKASLTCEFDVIKLENALMSQKFMLEYDIGQLILAIEATWVSFNFQREIVQHSNNCTCNFKWFDWWKFMSGRFAKNYMYVTSDFKWDCVVLWISNMGCVSNIFGSI